MDVHIVVKIVLEDIAIVGIILILVSGTLIQLSLLVLNA